LFKDLFEKPVSLKFTLFNSLFLLLGVTIFSQLVSEEPLTTPIFDWIELSIKVLILAPIIETLVFQLGPYLLFVKLKSRETIRSKLLLILLSSVLFGLTHNDDTARIIFSTIKGSILISCFLNYSKDVKMAILKTMFLHFVVNLLILVLLYWQFI